MHSIRALTVLGACFAASLVATTAFAEPQLPRLLPQDTAIVFHVRSIADVREQWKHSPFAKTLEEPDVEKFVQAVGDAIKGAAGEEEGLAEMGRMFSDETGMSVSEAVELLTGEVMVAWVDIRPALNDELESNPQVLLAAQIGDNREKVEKLLRSADDEIVEEEFQGETLYITMSKATDEEPAVEEACWAFVDDLVMVAQPKSLLQRTIAHLKQGGSDSLVDSPSFSRMVRDNPDSDVSLFVNLGSMIAAVTEKLKAEQAAAAEQGRQMGGPLAMMPAEMLMHGLGLDALSALTINGKIARDATTAQMALRWTERRGLLRMVAYGEPPAPRADFMPDSWPACGAARFSLNEMYLGVREAIREFLPPVDMQIQQQIGGLNQALGFDLERDVFGSFGDAMFNASTVNRLEDGSINVQQPTTQLIAFALNDSAAFSRALDLLLGLVPPGAMQMVQTRDYLGETIRSLTPPMPGSPSISIAVTRAHLLLSIGDVSMLETAIQNQGGVASSVWARREVNEALDRLPSGASMVSFSDMKALAPVIFEAFVAGFRQGMKDDGEEETPLKAPDPEVVARHWSTAASGAYVESDGIRMVSRIEHVE